MNNDLTPEKLLSMTAEERAKLPAYNLKWVDAGNNVDKYCTDCTSCSNCVGILNGHGLRCVAYGVQLTEDQWTELKASQK